LTCNDCSASESRNKVKNLFNGGSKATVINFFDNTYKTFEVVALYDGGFRVGSYVKEVNTPSDLRIKIDSIFQQKSSLEIWFEEELGYFSEIPADIATSPYEFLADYNNLTVLSRRISERAPVAQKIRQFTAFVVTTLGKKIDFYMPIKLYMQDGSEMYFIVQTYDVAGNKIWLKFHEGRDSKGQLISKESMLEGMPLEFDNLIDAKEFASAAANLGMNFNLSFGTGFSSGRVKAKFTCEPNSTKCTLYFESAQ
jgi:hypothetical protein